MFHTLMNLFQFQSRRF